MTILLLYCIYTYLYTIGIMIEEYSETKKYPAPIAYISLLFSPILVPIFQGMNNYKNL